VLKKIKQYLLIICGSISLILGIVGAFLPVLPTTPFLLLTIFCYLRSSHRLYQWVINNKIFGTYIYNYMTYRAISKSTCIHTFIFLWLSLILSMVIIKDAWIVFVLICVGIGVSIHIFTLKTIDET